MSAKKFKNATDDDTKEAPARVYMATGWLGPNTIAQSIQMLHYTCKPALIHKALVTGSPLYAGVLRRRAMRFLATMAVHESGSEELLECLEDLPIQSLDFLAMVVCLLFFYSLVAPTHATKITRQAKSITESPHTRDTEL